MGVASEEMPKNENEQCTRHPKGNWLAANLAYSCGLGLVNKKMFRIYPLDLLQLPHLIRK